MAGSKTVKGGAYKGGPLAHLAHLADFQFNKDFDPITVGPEMEPMPEEVVSDLSTDQQYGYRLYRMIRTGICPEKEILVQIAKTPLKSIKFLKGFGIL